MQTYTPEQLARTLMTSAYGDGVTRTIRRTADEAVSVNLTDLTAQEKGLARNAMAEVAAMAISAASGRGSPAAWQTKVSIPPSMTNSPWAKFTTSDAS